MQSATFTSSASDHRRLSAHKSGHALNNQLLRATLAERDAWELVTFEKAEEAPASVARLSPCRPEAPCWSFGSSPSWRWSRSASRSSPPCSRATDAVPVRLADLQVRPDFRADRAGVARAGAGRARSPLGARPGFTPGARCDHFPRLARRATARLSSESGRESASRSRDAAPRAGVSRASPRHPGRPSGLAPSPATGNLKSLARERIDQRGFQQPKLAAIAAFSAKITTFPSSRWR